MHSQRVAWEERVPTERVAASYRPVVLLVALVTAFMNGQSEE